MKLAQVDRELLLAGLTHFHTYVGPYGTARDIPYLESLPNHISDRLLEAVRKYYAVHVYQACKDIRVEDWVVFGEERQSRDWVTVEPSNPLAGKIGHIVRQNVRAVVSHPLRSFAAQVKMPLTVLAVLFVLMLVFESDIMLGGFAFGLAWLYRQYEQHLKHCYRLTKKLRHPFLQ